MKQPTKKAKKKDVAPEHITGKGRILSPQTVRILQRRYQVMCLRRDGYTLFQISESLGCSRAQAAEDLKHVLQETISALGETTEEHRQLQIERLDGLLKAYMPLAVGYTTEIPDPKKPGERKVVEVPPNAAYGQLILSLETRRAKLLALDVPEVKRLEVSGVREYVGVDLEQV